MVRIALLHPGCNLTTQPIRRWLGVEHVFLIDNDSRDGPAMIEQLDSEFDSSFLTLRSELMPHAQMKAYAWCAEEQRAHYNWLIFADLDEFLAVQTRCAA